MHTKCYDTRKAFTVVHLAVTFIQSDVNYIQCIHFVFLAFLSPFATLCATTAAAFHLYRSKIWNPNIFWLTLFIYGFREFKSNFKLEDLHSHKWSGTRKHCYQNVVLIDITNSLLWLCCLKEQTERGMSVRSHCCLNSGIITSPCHLSTVYSC